MELAKIIGKVWVTKKADGLDGQRFALAQFITSDGALSPRTLVACDTIGAGVGDTVLVAHGHAARAVLGRDVPVDCAVIAIVDCVERQ